MHPLFSVASAGAYLNVSVWAPPGATVNGPAGESIELEAVKQAAANPVAA